MRLLHQLTGDAHTFATDVWATRPHRHDITNGELANVFSVHDADALLSNAIRTPSLRIAQDGSVLAESRYTRRATLAGRPLTGLVDPVKALDLFDAGATLVFQGVHRSWPSVAELVATLEQELGHPCQANAYLTPPGAQGFSLHSDRHDVFVIHTHGAKTWTVHDGDHIQTVEMVPGRCLYLPTGTPHQAAAHDGVSLHLTVGVNQLTWADVVRSVTARVVQEDPGLQRHLPVGFHRDLDGFAGDLGDVLADAARSLAATDANAEAATYRSKAVAARSRPHYGGLRDRLRIASLQPSDKLAQRSGALIELRRAGAESDDDRIILRDRTIDLPPRVRSATMFVCEHRRFCPQDIPGLAPSSQLVLARRLLSEGLLTFATDD